MPLPINLEDLLSARTVESNRIEWKTGWNPDAIYRSICAFANDVDNTDGGYIIIGVEEKNGRAIRPVKGLSTETVAHIQQSMIGYNNLINPYYAPKLYIEEIDHQQIIVLRIAGGEYRPYEVPEAVTAKHKTWKPYIRRYASSIEAKGNDRDDVLALKNRTPFDDRPNRKASLQDISLLFVQEYLRKVKSRLYNPAESQSAENLLDQMSLLSGPPEYRQVRNVALMLFSEDPEKFFPGTYIELVHFKHDPADRKFKDAKFSGPVQLQIEKAMAYLHSNVFIHQITKIEGQAEAPRNWNFPPAAVEELISNSVFHRKYEVNEPIRVRIESDRMYVYNSGGPDRSVSREDFVSGRVLPQHYRNRRLGSFLKELDLTEAYASGIRLIIREMQQNGSPEPIFNFDDERTWFSVMLPIHPDFVKIEKDHVNENVNVHVNENVNEEISANQLNIINAMKTNNKITMEELAFTVGIAKTNIARNVKKLIDRGAISRIGPARGGYWQVNI